MALPKPKDRTNQIIVFLSGIFVAVLALIYLFNAVDLVPDNAGTGFVGYLDDVIVIFLLVFFVNRFIARFKLRFNDNKGRYIAMWKRGDILKVLLKPKTWFTILILTLAFAYFFWTLDVVPDTTVGLRWVDDAIVAIGALIALIRVYNK